MSSGLPIITVFGATGYQGGSVINSLLQTGKFAIRGITRNPQSNAARALAEKGVQVVQGDAGKPETLASAFNGAWGAYLVTSFWDPAQKLDPNTDYEHGRALVDAAVAGGVKFLVWSSLHDIEAASGGTLSVPHYTMKNKVEQYIKTLSVPAAFVYAGFYNQNWVNFPPFGVPRYDSHGKVKVETAVNPNVKIPVIDIEEDFGKFVVPIFLHPDQFQGQDILASTEYITVPQMVEAYERVSGRTVEIKSIDFSTVPIEELQATINLFNRYGYYLGEPLEPTLAKYPGVKFGTFEGWLKRSAFEPHPAA